MSEKIGTKTREYSGRVEGPVSPCFNCDKGQNGLENYIMCEIPKTFSRREIRREPCTITLTLHRDSNNYRLIIADNGTGIPKGIAITASRSLIVRYQLRGTAYTVQFPKPEGKEQQL
jgi:hypothetical protein